MTTNKTPGRSLRSPSEYIEGILRGDRVLLGRAITLVESRRPDHQQLAQEILEGCLPYTGRSVRIGITGSPGVGKSTFIESLGTYLTRSLQKRIAVLTIDPSSKISKGSILGDKTRMEKLASDDRAFIRPSPAGVSLGGVAARTRESMLLLEAAGHEVVFIETVGVGQSETAVHGMVDFFLLLLMPGAGDELQGIKRGIVEMADLIAINKADGDRVELAGTARKSYAQALHLFPPKDSGWTPKAVTCSSIEEKGIEEIWQLVEDFVRQTKENGWFEQHRKMQAKSWFYELVDQGIRQAFFHHPAIAEKLKSIEKKVVNGSLPASKAAGLLLERFLMR